MQRGTEVVKRKMPTMRPPLRPASRTHSATPTLNGRASPAASTISKSRASPPTAGVKRKDRDFEHDSGEDTNITVIVRCRGRNEREVQENSGVVVSTDGIKGKTVNLSMGPNALSNKTYHFDRVFSPAADQTTVFSEAITPILDEVISGFNCTVFAYGQTGTGKTYTMSGDISDVLPLPDESGIIPRALHSLFQRLENSKTEYFVKCSFIELYNEELRDLLAADDNIKLKLYDDASRKSHCATLVQGVEESLINSASKGLELLRIGSHKRQVAATKCNDLSSRSHTVFTINVYIKHPSDGGEDYVSAGKLNLVDLAGSENIQRSGAENKRATEAGLINKSLLTLGRVINALVDKSAHIPYRESKLTRLLQDSLGGRTKTCIIATLSPAKSNLEETISTLDYAFRAKNIRNKPQMNQMISKKTLFREFTTEIEKLKSELIAARHRNGVYLTPETYEEMTTESESRRLITEEQRDKLENLDQRLKSKTQELSVIINDFNGLKKTNEAITEALSNTQDTLQRTDLILEHTRQSLREEEMLRQAHQETEEALTQTGRDLLSTLGRTTEDIEGLHQKLRRRSDLHRMNRTKWEASQSDVTNISQMLDQRLQDFESDHQRQLSDMTERIQHFVTEQLASCEVIREAGSRNVIAFSKAQDKIMDETSRAHDQMNVVIEEIMDLRSGVKEKLGQGLNGLSDAAQRISAGVVAELGSMHAELHNSYSSFGRELKTSYDDILQQVNTQREYMDNLESQLSAATKSLTQANASAISKFEEAVEEERRRNMADRALLLQNITALVTGAGEVSEKRIDAIKTSLQTDVAQGESQFQQQMNSGNEALNSLRAETQSLERNVSKSRESAKLRIKQDWTAANERNTAIQDTTRTIHEETVSLVEGQMHYMDHQLQSFDGIVKRLKEENGRHHENRVQSLKDLGSLTQSALSETNKHLEQSSSAYDSFNGATAADLEGFTRSLDSIQTQLREPMEDLRDRVSQAPLLEYTITGQTPQKTAYPHPSALPSTADHDALLLRFRQPEVPETVVEADDSTTPISSNAPSPSKAQVYSDMDYMTETVEICSPSDDHTTATNIGLREIDANICGGSVGAANVTNAAPGSTQQPRLRSTKRQVKNQQHAIEENSAKLSKRMIASIAEGRENQPLSVSVSSRGRVLRSRNS